MPDFHMIETNGVHLRVAVDGDGPLVLFVHGFPESWYSWRHQMRAVANAGFRAAAPDVRGYGGSDKPDPVAAYTMEEITADMAGLAKTLSPNAPAVIVGHDWGAPIAWNTALLHPGQIRAVAGLSVPYVPPGDRAAIDVFKAFFTARGMFFYQVYFQEIGVGEAELEADPAATIRKFYYAISGDAPEGTWPVDKKHGDTLLHRLPEPPMPLPWLSEEDVAYYASQFEASGFRGPLNRYRTSHEDHAFLRAARDSRLHQPALFIGGTHDLVLKMYPGDVVQDMKPHFTDLQGVHLLEGCGHWTQQERADEVNHLLVDWLTSL
ncbi:MAG: alpha/beta hydrolase [Pseudomonadota bacterium]